jgi:hypothetical protein
VEEVLKDLCLKLVEGQFDLLLKEVGIKEEELEMFTLKDKCVGVAVVSSMAGHSELKQVAIELYNKL